MEENYFIKENELESIVEGQHRILTLKQLDVLRVSKVNDSFCLYFLPSDHSSTVQRC